MRKFILSVLISISMISCVGTTPVNIIEKEKPITDFPPSPTLTVFTRKPIVEKIENDFRVSDEFVNNGILLKKYNDKINEWKKEHNVK
jgi:hypothetical protein